MKLRSVLKKSDDVQSLLALLQGMLYAFKRHETLVIEVRQYEPGRSGQEDHARPHIPHQEVVHLLRQILSEAELTQKQLATKIGMPQTTLCDLMNGRLQLSHASAQKLIRGHHLSEETKQRLLDLATPIAKFRTRKT